MLRSIVVPVDHSPASDRGVAVAVALARRASLPVRLLTVCNPSEDRITAESELRARAVRAFPVPCTATVLVADELEDALVTAIAERPGSLVVMGTRARHAVGEFLLGSVAEALLVRGDHPLVLVGPHVDASRFPSPQHLVIAVDTPATADALVPAVAEWSACFGGRPWVVQVGERTTVAAGGGDVAETGFVHRAANALAAAGVEAEWDVLHDPDRCSALIAFADDLGGGVLAVATHRWSDPERVHWSSTARQLVHRSPHPVLVLPLH